MMRDTLLFNMIVKSTHLLIQTGLFHMEQYFLEGDFILLYSLERMEKHCFQLTEK